MAEYEILKCSTRHYSLIGMYNFIVDMEEAAHLWFAGPLSSYVLCLPRAPETVLTKLEGKGDRCPPWKAESGISFSVPNRVSWNELGHGFPH